MNALSMRAFSTELVKLAMEIKDPDIQALQAEKKGKEYLQGGRLPANTEAETSFVPKIASITGWRSPARLAATGMDMDSPVDSPHNRYAKAKDWMMTGVKGVTTGAGLMGLGHALVKAPMAPGATFSEGLKASVPALRAGALLGGGLAIGDKLLTHHLKKKEMMKQAMLGSQTFTPARELKASGETAHFENMIHKGPGVRPSGLMGTAGRLPRI